MPTVYLLHLKIPEGCNWVTRHYIGYTTRSVKARLKRHRAGDGARMLALANNLGIRYNVVKTWNFETREEAYAFEQRFKQAGHYARHCKVCRQLR